jgi:hypothetical protein
MAGQNHYIVVVNKSFENVAQFKYFGSTATNKNCIHEEIKSRLNSWECLLPCSSESFNFLSTVKNKKIAILPVVLYVCKTWSLTLRVEHILSVFVNRVLRRIFAPKRDEVTGDWRKLHNEELNNFYSSPHIISMMK